MSDYDLNGNGVIDPEEKAMMLEDRRMRIEDDNAQRDQSRKMIWWVLHLYLDGIPMQLRKRLLLLNMMVLLDLLRSRTRCW